MSTKPTSNRAAFPPEELLKYEGKWVAFSPECKSIVAAHEDVEELAKLVEDAGFDPQDVWFEGVPDEDPFLGGLS
jgi:predicted RNase H-like HicB family nuclease